MTYQEAKEFKDLLTLKNEEDSKALHKFLELGEDKVLKGLPTKEIRDTKEYKEAVIKFEKSFKQLQEFNKLFLKTFKKEYAKERREKRLMKCK